MAAAKTKLQKLLAFSRKYDPIWFTLIYTVLSLAYGAFFIFYPKAYLYFPNVISVILLFLLSVPVLMTVFHIIHYQTTWRSLFRLASLYLQIILMFSVVYFFAVSDYTGQQLEEVQNGEVRAIQSAITNIDTQWTYMFSMKGIPRVDVFKQYLICFQDCFHFSLVTSTTLGYGDMVPKTPLTKLLVDVQVLLSFFLIAFGIGTFFAQHSRRRANPLDLIKDVDLNEDQQAELKNLIQQQEENLRKIRELLEKSDKRD